MFERLPDGLLWRLDSCSAYRFWNERATFFSLDNIDNDNDNEVQASVPEHVAGWARELQLHPDLNPLQVSDLTDAGITPTQLLCIARIISSDSFHRKPTNPGDKPG